jgi:uroporphyrinogen decarboxylase
MVAGGTSKDHAPARLMAYEHPEHFQALIDILVTASFDYLSRQIQSGVEVVQIFDSWAGVLPKQQFEAWVIAPTTQLVAKLKAKHPEVPIIGFPRGAGTKALDYVYKTGVDALGIDEQADRDYLALNLPKNFPVQGNLDPALLHAGGNALVAEVHAIMQTFKNRPHIFNLGHGIWPTTPIPHVEALLTCLRGQA